MSASKRKAVVFIDGQNLFHNAKRQFQVNQPNYDPKKLAEMAAARMGCELVETRFYSGVPPREYNEYWHEFWQRKLLAVSRSGVKVETRPLSYQRRGDVAIPQEKGIDVRLSLDMVATAREGKADTLILFSSDQDFIEAVKEARMVAMLVNTNLTVATFFPDARGERHGVYNTDWQSISREEYERCLDPHDYRPHELSKKQRLERGEKLQDPKEQLEKERAEYKQQMNGRRPAAGA